MQKLIIATIGFSLSMGVAGAAIAQSASTPGQMQTAPGTNGDSSTANPAGPSAGSAPSTSSTQNDPSNANTGMPSASASGQASSGDMSAPPAPQAKQSYPRCSASVHDECRQRQ